MAIILDLVKDAHYEPDQIVNVLVNFYAVMNPAALGSEIALEKAIPGIMSELGIDITGLQAIKSVNVDKNGFMDYNMRLAATLLLARNGGDAGYDRVMGLYADLMTELLSLRDQYSGQVNDVIELVNSKLESVKKYVVNSEKAGNDKSADPV